MTTRVQAPGRPHFPRHQGPCPPPTTRPTESIGLRGTRAAAVVELHTRRRPPRPASPAAGVAGDFPEAAPPRGTVRVPIITSGQVKLRVRLVEDVPESITSVGVQPVGPVRFGDRFGYCTGAARCSVRRSRCSLKNDSNSSSAWGKWAWFRAPAAGRRPSTPAPSSCEPPARVALSGRRSGVQEKFRPALLNVGT
jgi:hypothetical protein